METKKVKHLLQRYFKGVSNDKEEKTLKAYFKSDEVAEEFKEYTGFFRGISEISKDANRSDLEDEIMDFIIKNEQKEKNNYRWLYTVISGVAASLIIIIGGMLLYYQQQKQPFEDTFENPEIAYAYAEKTLNYVSSKYNKGLACLSNFDKLETATEPLHKGVKTVNEVFEEIEKVTDKD